MAMESKHIVSLLVVSIILIVLYMSYGKDKRYKKDKKKGKSVKENFVDEMMREDNSTFSIFNWEGNSEENEDNIIEEEDTIEHFPQMTPMNVMYSDTNGNLSTTSDLGLQNLTITGNGALQLGSKFRLNANKDFWADDEWLRLTNSANTDYYGGFAAGKLWAQGNLSTDTLNVRSDGTVEKGLTVKGDITAKSNVNVASGKMITVRDDNHAIGQSGVWGSTRDGTTVLGWDGGILASNNSGVGGYKEALVWDNGRNVSVGNNLSVGGKLQEGGNNLIHRGTIAMWNGDSPPAGWALCDGVDGRPDLRNKFIVGAGAGSNYYIGQKGGADSVTLTAEQMPSHTHKLNDNGGYKAFTGGHVNCGCSGYDQILHGGFTGFNSLYTGGAGSSQPHENRPPFYALTFIYKL